MLFVKAAEMGHGWQCVGDIRGPYSIMSFPNLKVRRQSFTTPRAFSMRSRFRSSFTNSWRRLKPRDSNTSNLGCWSHMESLLIKKIWYGTVIVSKESTKQNEILNHSGKPMICCCIYIYIYILIYIFAYHYLSMILRVGTLTHGHLDFLGGNSKGWTVYLSQRLNEKYIS